MHAWFRFLLLALLPLTSHALDRLPAFTPQSRVLFIGDSITDGGRGRGADPNHILGHSYVFLLAARHGAAFAEDGVEFLNRGISGNTILDLQKRWPADVLDLKPDVLSILIGVNDNGHGLSVDEYEQVYERLIAQATEANPRLKLVLCEPFSIPSGPVKGEKFDFWFGAIRKRQAIVARLAEKHGAALVSFQRVFDEAMQRAPAETWIWDGVHPTYRGHQLMAEEWERAVRAFWKQPATAE